MDKIDQLRSELAATVRERDELAQLVDVLEADRTDSRYLVVACYADTDVPIGLMATWRRARVLAGRVYRRPPRVSPFDGGRVLGDLISVQVVRIGSSGLCHEATLIEHSGGGGDDGSR